MKYLTKIGMVYARTNKLDEAIFQLLKNYDRKFFNMSQLGAIESEILGEIKRLNTLYPKCKPYTGHWSNINRTGDHNDISLVLSPHAIVRFKLYAITNGNYTPKEIIYDPAQLEIV